MTTRLYNQIKMPDNSHGKLFIVKAAFLKHPSDVPIFGPQPTFTMPFSTEDIVPNLARRRSEEAERRGAASAPGKG
jgi:hypothetical protein